MSKRFVSFGFESRTAVVKHKIGWIPGTPIFKSEYTRMIQKRFPIIPLINFKP